MGRRLLFLSLALLFLSGCGRRQSVNPIPTIFPEATPATAATVAPAPTATPGVASLRESLGHPSWQGRLATARRLPERDDIPAAERATILIEALEREVAAPETLPPPDGAYLSADALLRLQLTRTLSELGPEAMPALRQAAESGAEPVRAWAILALGLAGEADVAPEVQTLLRESDDAEIRMTAARALGVLNHREAIPDLERALSDPFSATGEDHLGSFTIYPVREQAAWALETLGMTVERLDNDQFRLLRP